MIKEEDFENKKLHEEQRENITELALEEETENKPAETETENKTAETPLQQDIQKIISQYTTTGPFVDLCKCEIYEKLLKEEESELVIKEATTGYYDPQSGQETGNFVTYVIEFGESKTRKRYSDFELLAAHLNRVYPHQVIPPIPEKETLTSIISGYTGLKDKHDPFLIQHRIRLFQSFLMNIRNNAVLRGDHYFHRLIDSTLIGSAWSEGITAVPGKLGNELGGAAEGGKGGKVPDPLVLRLEEMTHKYRDGIRSIEKGQSKLLKRLKDESNVLSDLGASFNAFSLELADNLTNPNDDDKNSTNQISFTGTNENKVEVPKWTNGDGPGDQEPTNQNTDKRTNQSDLNKNLTNEGSSFRSQLEMIGQSSDSEVIHLHSLIRHHELLRDKLQEMILYCACILKSLGNLTQKRNNLEDFHDQINARKNALMQMESNVRADEQGESNENLKKLRKNIEELENSKKQKLSEMNEFSNQLLKDIDRTFAYFGETWKESLRALAECQSHWHEEAIKSWKLK